MAYTPQTWADGESGQTPITAARLNYIESGVQAATSAAEAKVDPTSLPEAVQDIVGTMIVAGTNVTKVYDDNAGTITISAAGGTGGGTVSDATTGSKGIVQLAGDLAGTAAAPTVPGLAGKVDSTDPRLSDARTPTTHSHTAAQISDATATGRSVLTAADATAARTAINAGTSSLALGTTGATAAAGNHTHTKADVGLGNVDNTSDANKPVSTATQTALDGKVTGTGITAVQVLTAAAYAALGTKSSTTLYVLVG